MIFIEKSSNLYRILKQDGHNFAVVKAQNMETQKELTSKHRPERCPVCAGEVWTIVYGEPTYEAYEKRFENKVVFRGCCITDHDPAWQCIECDALIYKG